MDVWFFGFPRVSRRRQAAIQQQQQQQQQRSNTNKRERAMSYYFFDPFEDLMDDWFFGFSSHDTSVLVFRLLVCFWRKLSSDTISRYVVIQKCNSSN